MIVTLHAPTPDAADGRRHRQVVPTTSVGENQFDAKGGVGLVRQQIATDLALCC